MAFELWIQRYVEERAEGVYVSGQDIGELEFHGLMQVSGCTNIAGTNTYRLTHETGVPWLLAELDTPLDRPSRIRLSLSYTNYRFGRGYGDAFEAGLEVAHKLKAHLIEEHQRTEVTEDNLHALVEPEGEYMQFHLSCWQETLAQINSHNRAPVEYPLAHVDSVREYFCLSVLTDQPLDPEKIAEELGYSIRMRKESTFIGAINDPLTQRPKVKILFREDGKVQLQPFYWKESFADAAAETIEAAEAIEKKFAGKLFFFTEPVSDGLRETLKTRINSLGVDFYWWVGEFFRNAHASV